MQLFSIGLLELSDDGSPVVDPTSGKEKETYTNEDIESYARAWTGFVRQGVRGNYEERKKGTTDNRLDPMHIVAKYRDPFPKTNLNRGFIGDGYMLCTDLPAHSFLKKGATYRLLGGKSLPDLMSDPEEFANDETYNVSRVELAPPSQLYERLYNGGNYELTVELDTDLDCTPNTVECDVDTLRVVKVGSVYWEFVPPPCVQMAFYDNGKQIQMRDNYRQGQMCANPSLVHAREACCRQERYQEVRAAEIETDSTYLYEGERMSFETAKDRCMNYGKDICVYEAVKVIPSNDNWRKGYHWTDRYVTFLAVSL